MKRTSGFSLIRMICLTALLVSGCTGQKTTSRTDSGGVTISDQSSRQMKNQGGGSSPDSMATPTINIIIPAAMPPSFQEDGADTDSQVTVSEPTDEPTREPEVVPAKPLRLDVEKISVESFGRFHSLLVSHAMNTLKQSNYKQAGHFKASLSLKKKFEYGLFTWCTAKNSDLTEIVSKVSYSMQVDDNEITSDSQSWIFHRDQLGNYCALPGYLVTNIQGGTHHIVITQHIKSAFSQQIGNFAVGDRIYDLNVSFE